MKMSYTGRGDTIEITDGVTTLTTSFYEMRARGDQLASSIPPPCPECEGQGDVVVEERDLVVCGTCKGSHVGPTDVKYLV